MQSSDQNDRIVQAVALENQLSEDNKKNRRSVPEQIYDAIKTAEAKGAVKHVIANMPNHGDELEINGLKFKVSFVNNRRGDVHLKLMGMEDAPRVDPSAEVPLPAVQEGQESL